MLKMRSRVSYLLPPAASLLPPTLRICYHPFVTIFRGVSLRLSLEGIEIRLFLRTTLPVLPI